MKSLQIMVVHGPNLNLLGEREPNIYGSLTLEDINQAIADLAKEFSVTPLFFQSNAEGEIIDFLHDHRFSADGLLINPAAYTHYSIAIRDAIAAINLPAVEVHLSDIHSREEFRRTSVIRDVCLDQVSGLGLESYLQGLRRLVEFIRPAR